MAKRSFSEMASEMAILEQHFEASLLNSGDKDKISSAFRKWALKNHPDKGGDTKLFQEVCGAYATFIGREEEVNIPNYEDMEDWLKDFNTGHGFFSSPEVWEDFVSKCRGM